MSLFFKRALFSVLFAITTVIAQAADLSPTFPGGTPTSGAQENTSGGKEGGLDQPHPVPESSLAQPSVPKPVEPSVQTTRETEQQAQTTKKNKSGKKKAKKKKRHKAVIPPDSSQQANPTVEHKVEDSDAKRVEKWLEENEALGKAGPKKQGPAPVKKSMQTFSVYLSPEPEENKPKIQQPERIPPLRSTPSVKLTPPAKPLKLSSEPERTLEQKLAEAALKFQADLKSAEIGDSEAQLRVGMQLYQGQGVLQDRKKGFSWILEAAEDGKYSPESLHILGQAYFKGTDTEKNYVAARKWLGLLADQDNFSAKNDFAYLLYHGLGGETDYAKAFELYKQAAIHGDVLAQANLGLMYATGTGTEVDKARAYAWYSFAARQGNGAAAKNQNDLLKDMSWEELNAAQRISIELYREVERRNPKP